MSSSSYNQELVDKKLSMSWLAEGARLYNKWKIYAVDCMFRFCLVNLPTIQNDFNEHNCKATVTGQKKGVQHS